MGGIGPLYENSFPIPVRVFTQAVASQLEAEKSGHTEEKAGPCLDVLTETMQKHSSPSNPA